MNQMLVSLLTNVSAVGILVSNFSHNQKAFCTLHMKPSIGTENNKSQAFGPLILTLFLDVLEKINRSFTDLLAHIDPECNFIQKFYKLHGSFKNLESNVAVQCRSSAQFSEELQDSRLYAQHNNAHK